MSKFVLYNRAFQPDMIPFWSYCIKKSFMQFNFRPWDLIVCKLTSATWAISSGELILDNPLHGSLPLTFRGGLIGKLRTGMKGHSGAEGKAWAEADGKKHQPWSQALSLSLFLPCRQPSIQSRVVESSSAQIQRLTKRSLHFSCMSHLSISSERATGDEIEG